MPYFFSFFEAPYKTGVRAFGHWTCLVMDQQLQKGFCPLQELDRIKVPFMKVFFLSREVVIGRKYCKY